MDNETNPINGNDLGSVAENLIMETPTNPEPVAEKVVEVTEDTQTEAIEDAEVVEDVDVASGIDEEIEETDVEDIEIEETEVQQEPELHDVKIDGEERKVTLEELKQDFSGQKYIQKGMAENAATRKELEAESQKLTQERRVVIEMAQQLQSGGMPQVPEYPSEELRTSDPLGFSHAVEDYRRAVEKQQEWRQKVQYIAEQEARAQEEEETRFLSQQAMRVSEWLPEFKDPEKRKLFIDNLKDKSAEHYGLTEEQFRTVKTSEEVMILNDALKWKQLQKNKAQVTKKAEGARTTVVKPSARKTSATSKATKAKTAKANMSKTGSIDSVADYLLS